jgi:ferredoxin-type protein NapF
MRVKKHRLVQTVCFAAAVLFLWPPAFWKDASKYVVQLSPFAAICDAIALRSVSFGLGAGLVFAAIAIFRRRWFCTYACPMGLLLDGISRIGLQKSAWWARCPNLGRYAAILTMAGAVVGYPLLLWMDPLAVFSSSFALRTAGSVLSALLAVLGLTILIALSFTSGAVWCARLCPLGGTLDLLASTKKWSAAGRNDAPAPAVEGRRLFIVAVAGLAIALLARRLGATRRENAPLRPPGARAESIFSGLCLRCGNCVRACPVKIIHADVGRAGAAGLLAPIIRYEKAYCLEDCTACTQVCPSGAIQVLELREKQRYVIGEALMDGSLCVLALGQRDCDACVRACPFDAVRIHWDEEHYIAYPIVDWKKCNGCGACQVACPTYGAKAIQVWKKID